MCFHTFIKCRPRSEIYRSTQNFWPMPKIYCETTPKFHRPELQTLNFGSTLKLHWPTAKFYRPTHPTKPTQLFGQRIHATHITHKLKQIRQLSILSYIRNKEVLRISPKTEVLGSFLYFLLNLFSFNSILFLN